MNSAIFLFAAVLTTQSGEQVGHAELGLTQGECRTLARDWKAGRRDLPLDYALPSNADRSRVWKRTVCLPGR